MPNKMIIRLSLSILIAMLFVPSSVFAGSQSNFSQQGSFQPRGDGDVFPHSCVDFSGSWRNDDGGLYWIFQENCSRIQIRFLAALPENDFFVDLVPDNKIREVRAADADGVSIHRWNSLYHGTSIRAWSRMNYSDRVVYEESTYEFVSRDTILESVYRYVDFYDNRAVEDLRTTDQQLFRRYRIR
jgi:hypothetical protein